jgi:hypothetical protein
MLKFSRRKLLAGAGVLMIARAAPSALLISRAAEAARGRLLRKECFFGLHFDLHPRFDDTELGRDVTDEMVAHLLKSVRPDFIQYDSKGHPGYLGFASKTGMSSPGIVQDSLAIWRRVTAAHGVALYNHFSGVLDGAAIEKHPEWARIGPDGQRSPQETSLFSAYEGELMIPELTEAAGTYDLDGSWVDGDCWAVQPDYCDEALRRFVAATGISVPPKKPEDPGWHEFLDLQREAFRQYVARYVDALHHARPGYQITSNWMYSTFAPERPALPLDFLSGDVTGPAAVRMARLEARYLSRCGKPWDLMSWGFESDAKFGYSSTKPVAELEQEAAVILAQGGAYQIYFVPTRAGWIDERVVKTAAEVAAFCRARQRWSHQSESVPEVGVLFSGRTLYRTTGRVFGGWDWAETPAAGALDLLLSCGYSVDVIPDWQLAECAVQYPLLFVPDWKDIGQQVASTLMSYVAGGGKLLVCGAENARLLSGDLKLGLHGEAQERRYFVADDSGFAEVAGSWIAIDAAQGDVIAHAYPAPDTRKDALPLAVRVAHGKGNVVVCPGPIASAYGNGSTPIIRSVLRAMVDPLHAPMVRMDGKYPALEIVLRKKEGQMLIHFVNSEGAPDSSEHRHSGIVPSSGAVRLRILLSRAPAKVWVEPEGRLLAGEYKGGEWTGVLPDLSVHSFLRIESR